MREIKFRAYNKLDDLYITDELILYNGCWFDGFRALKDYSALDVDGGKIVIQQFTGLHDKNGNEIYEGDIITDSYGIKREVFFSEFSEWMADAHILYTINGGCVVEKYN